MSTRHFTMGMVCTTQLRSSIILKNEKQTWEHVYQASYYQYQQNPYNKLNKNYPNHIRISYFQISTKITQTIFKHHIFKSQQKLKNQEIKGYINMKYFEKNRKSIPFLEVWRRDDDENGGFFRETRWVCERDERTRQ